MKRRDWGVLLLAHGTVRDPGELFEFLKRIRRGRPPSEELVRVMRRRYEAIGGSPLEAITRKQAQALEARLGRPCAVAMRLSRPEPDEVLPELLARGAERVCLLPMAPFSVPVYVEAARAVLDGIESVGVPPWGEHRGFVAAQTARVRAACSGASDECVILTAHSLPERVIAMGDPYAEQFVACARAVGEALGGPYQIAYQSQGADGGAWLGPELLAVMTREAEAGARRLVVAPIGFVAEHVETLYDLDIEARAHAAKLGADFVRVPAPNDDPAFVDMLAELVRSTMEPDAS
jgi:ferrochelatase